jgi:hypothetical protein
METLRERLDTIASTTGAAVNQTTLAGSSALHALQTQHTSYAQSAQQVSIAPVLPPAFPPNTSNHSTFLTHIFT